jgi:hypothetical protein
VDDELNLLLVLLTDTPQTSIPDRRASRTIADCINGHLAYPSSKVAAMNMMDGDLIRIEQTHGKITSPSMQL